MARVPLAIPAGLNTDDTSFASSPAWSDMDGARFVEGRPQVKGGWESVVTTLLTGVCRSILTWTDTAATLNVAFGTNSNLALFQGGALFDITPAAGFTPGAVDGTGSTGFGTGAFGIGGFGSPSASDYFPLTWSLSPYGQTLLASPRNQTIFQWSNNTGSKAVALTNAPAQVTYSLVARDFVFALGCSQEVGGVFNPVCIRHSGLRAETSWTTDITSGSTSREYILPGGGRIVGGRQVGKDFLAWTSHKLFYASYVGQVAEVWTFDEVGDKCGLIGPNAAVVLGSTAYWISPDRQIHSYTVGGAVTSVGCPIRIEFAKNLAASQGDKIVASTVAEFNEIRFDYPDARDGYENSRYISADTQVLRVTPARAWHKGLMARTAMVDAGPSSNPCGATYAGNVYWHERGNSADGAALSGFIKTADVFLDDEWVMLTTGFWPDIAGQIGPIMVDVSSKIYPQGDITTYPTLTITPGQARCDFKAKGRLFRVKISWNSSPAAGRLGLLVFEAKPAGKK
jgi:hypothetical protein